jgi:hypothetical protein
MKYTKRPIEVEAISFEELVELGKKSEEFAGIIKAPEIMPWSFQYKGHSITHETDECYLIPTLEGTMKITPEDMLLTGVRGEIYPCKKDIFIETYEPVIVPSENTEDIKASVSPERTQHVLHSKGSYYIGDPKHVSDMLGEEDFDTGDFARFLFDSGCVVVWGTGDSEAVSNTQDSQGRIYEGISGYMALIPEHILPEAGINLPEFKSGLAQKAHFLSFESSFGVLGHEDIIQINGINFTPVK